MTSRLQLGRSLRYVVAALLTGLHLELLIERISSQQLFDPLVVIRWIAACGVVAGLVVLRHRGQSLWRGRTALVLWLIVVLLHGGAVPMATSPGLNETELIAVVVSTLLFGVSVPIVGCSCPTLWCRVENPFALHWRSSSAVCGLVPRPPPSI